MILNNQFIDLNIAKARLEGSSPLFGAARFRHNTLFLYFLDNPTAETGPLKREQMTINYD